MPQNPWFRDVSQIAGFGAVFDSGLFLFWIQMTQYYENANDFDGIEPADYVMPYDVKRLISHCGHTFHKRFYFFSPSERRFYKYNANKKTAKVKKCKALGNRPSPRYRFSTDDDKDDEITVSKHFMKRIEGMKSLILKRAKK